MRIQVSPVRLAILLSYLRKEKYSDLELAKILNVNRRTVYDWLHGKYTIPQAKFLTLLELSSLDKEQVQHEVLADWWNAASSGRKAGEIFKLSGRKLSNPRSQSEGGIESYRKRRLIIGDIYTRKSIRKPSKESLELAEFIGIIIGDGSITKYQVSISSNTTDDSNYIGFLKPFIEDLFLIKVAQMERQGRNCTVTTVSSVELVNFIKELGLPAGDKIRNKIDIPDWIKRNDGLAKSCLRGIFDTDGCIFYETHNYKSSTYSYPRMSFVNASEPLLVSIFTLLKGLGFSPKRRYRRVNLEQFTDIERYFTIVSTSNPKHVTRFKTLGEVG